MLQRNLRESHANRVTTVMQVGRFAIVLGLHLALLFWLATAQPQEAAQPGAVRMDVRTIEAPPAPAVPEPLPVVPLPTQSLPSPQRVAAPKAPPVLAAATLEGPAPMSTSPPPDVPIEATVPASPPTAAVPGLTAPAAASTQAPVVTPARFDADYLNNPAPAYPLRSRMLKEQGTVLLLVDVTALGGAERVQLHQSSGRPRLDDAALEAVRHWRFVPARRGPQAIAASVIVPIVFELDR